MMTPAAIVTTQLDILDNTIIQQELIDPQTGAKFKLVGLDETLEQLQQCKPRLRDIMHAESAMYVLLTMFAGGSEMLDNAQAGGTGKTSIIGGGYIISALNQLRHLYNSHLELQSLQEKFISQLPVDMIDNYKPLYSGNAITAENIIATFKKNGHVEITLKNDLTFELQNKSFWSLRMFGGALIGAGASIASAGTYIKLRLDANAEGKMTGVEDTDLQNVTSEIWFSLIGAAAPLPNLYETYVSLRYKQATALFDAISKALKVYEDSSKVQDIPDWLLTMADVYMAAEYKGANGDLKERAKAEKERVKAEKEKQSAQLVEQLSAQTKTAREEARLANERAKRAEESLKELQLAVESIKAIPATAEEQVRLLKKASSDDIEANSKKKAEAGQKAKDKQERCIIF